ncbi:MAG: alpha-ketoacid dehydrogenase subunit beta [Clostridia bacterium]|nr:alpha-ketoacid dehydrogenase subunit beta [Clostridia bacterium]
MSRIISYGKAINEALHQEMEKDESVFILGEDVAKMGGDFGITAGIWSRWPKRAKDTPLSEAAILGLANGAAFCGLRPVAEIMFADFITECFDQLVNNSAKAHYMYNGEVKCPLVVRTVCGGGFRAAYHHSQMVESWLLNVPGLYIVAPSTPYEAKGLLISAIRNDNPVVFLEHKMLYNLKGEVPEEYYSIDLCKADIKKEGTDVTVIATMKMVHLALEAAQKLAPKGISVEVIDPRTLFPYDKETIINSVAKTGRVVIAQEGPKTGGYAAEISAMLMEEMFEFLKAPIKRVTSLDSHVPFAPIMEDYVLPGPSDVENAIQEVLEY